MAPDHFIKLLELDLARADASVAAAQPGDSAESPATVVDRETFAKINEVENISLSAEMEETFGRFDA